MSALVSEPKALIRKEVSATKKNPPTLAEGGESLIGFCPNNKGAPDVKIFKRWL